MINIWLTLVYISLLCHTLPTHPDLGKTSRHGVSYRLSLCFQSFDLV